MAAEGAGERTVDPLDKKQLGLRRLVGAGILLSGLAAALALDLDPRDLVPGNMRSPGEGSLRPAHQTGDAYSDGDRVLHPQRACRIDGAIDDFVALAD